jgi:hypothetical protein
MSVVNMTVTLSEYWVGASSRASALATPLSLPSLFYDDVVVYAYVGVSVGASLRG